MAFTLKTINAFEMTRRMAACEIPPKTAGHRAFVGVYPPNPERGCQQWIVRRFEIPPGLVEEYFGEEELKEKEIARVDSMQEAEAVLARWNIDSSRLDAPWKCDYPL